MSCRDEPIDDRVYHVMVRCEKFAACRGDLDSNLVVRRNQRCPCLRHIRLAGRGEDESINHLTHNARFRLVVSDCIGIVHSIYDRRRGHSLRSLGKPGGDGAKKNKSYVSHQHGALVVATDFMSNGANHNSATAVATEPAAFSSTAGDPPVATGPIRHLYVHIPFCARICPYCAFYKDLLDRSQTQRFCQAILHEVDQQRSGFAISPKTIYFGGGTPTALTTAQLEFLLGGFRERLDLSFLEEWTIEANPGSVSMRKATLLRKLGVSRISLGVQSWDDKLLEVLGREHSAPQAEQSFRILREAGF